MSILYQALSRAARDHARRSGGETGDMPGVAAPAVAAEPTRDEGPLRHAGPRLRDFTTISLSRRRRGSAGDRRSVVILGGVAILLAAGWLTLSSLSTGSGSLVDTAAEIPGVAELAALLGFAPAPLARVPAAVEMTAEPDPFQEIVAEQVASLDPEADMLTPPEALDAPPAPGGGIEAAGAPPVAAQETPRADELAALVEAEAEVMAEPAAAPPEEAFTQPVDAPPAAARETLEQTLQRLTAERGFTDLAPPIAVVRDSGDVGAPGAGVAAVPAPGSPDFQISVNDRSRTQQASFEAAYASLLAGNTEGALDLYLDVLKDDPGNTFALFGLASTLQRIGWLAEARATYEELLAIEPNHPGALANMMTLISQEAPEQALANLQRLYEINPGFSPIPAQMAMLLAERGNYQEAIRLLRLASDLSPENVMYVYNLAIIHDRMGDYVEARKRYEQVLATAAVRDVTVPLEAVRQRVSYLKKL